MDTFDREIHPIYGSVPSDGDYVKQGELLGLSTDAKELVQAPRNGWVKLVSLRRPDEQRLIIHILGSRTDERLPTDKPA